MEDVLDVYHRPYDPRFPQVCLDETSKQLLEHVRIPVPARKGVPARVDDEYRRCGTANIFLATEPLKGRVITEVTERRSAIDFGRFLGRLAETYASAERIVLVMDNLSTHTLASLYEAFEPVKAQRLARKFEIHYTPKHGSWLNVAEIQLSVLARQALDQRIASPDQLRAIIHAWHAARSPAPVRWRFTTVDARIKLRRLYPDVELAAAGRVGSRLAPPRPAGSGGERSLHSTETLY
jgi:hypothetical protein